MDDLDIWMLLGREMFETCRSANELRKCRSGLLVCFMTKHYIIVVIDGTPQRLWIIKDPAAKERGGRQFLLQTWRDSVSSPTTGRFTIGDDLLVSIGETPKRFAIGEACQRFLTGICNNLQT